LRVDLGCFPVVLQAALSDCVSFDPFASVLKKAEIAISMDGKGAWRDYVFVDRLWRSIKYVEVHLHACKTVPEVRADVGRYLTFQNT
jgi:putative transposase